MRWLRCCCACGPRPHSLPRTLPPMNDQTAERRQAPGARRHALPRGLDDPAVPAEFSFDEIAVDGLRMLLERRDVPAWLTSAAWRTCASRWHPTRCSTVPCAGGGARPDQAMCWPALWFAGERDLFPCNGADPRRRKRARRIDRVKQHLSEVAARLGVDREYHDG